MARLVREGSIHQRRDLYAVVQGSLSMNRQRKMTLGMLGLGIGYFLCFAPYTAIAKSLSSGLLPGAHQTITGPVLLPASALGMLCAMPVFMLATGYWRYARSRPLGRLRIPLPGRETALSAAFMTLIVSTTTLNFSFAGFAIVFMLVMERMETIVLAPTIDLLHRRKIHAYSWVALGLCLLAVVAAFTDVHAYRLSAVAFASVGTYLAGYAGRFQVMSKYAKKGTRDMRYFAEEHMATPVILVALLGVLALIGQGPALLQLREGFTTFLASPGAPYGFAIGVCYEGLFIFTSLIFLDPREFAFCMPVHVCASLLAGVAASLGLSAIFGTAPPSGAQYVAAACVIGAAFALSYPVVRSRWIRARRRLLLFVCGGNTVRSPIAASIANAELLALSGRESSRWGAESAGVSVHHPGAPMPALAQEALRLVAVPTATHAARPLTRKMCERSVAVFCMTLEQRDAVLALTPKAAGRTFCLDPGADIAEPAGDSLPDYEAFVVRVRELVRSRLGEQLANGREPAYLSASANGSA
jgi:protein-tyrosine-phosphatase